jgi:hypothetical protein
MRKRYCAAAKMKLRKDMTERKEYRFYPQRSNSILLFSSGWVRVDLHEQV